MEADFSHAFFLNSLWASTFAAVFLTLPGVWIAALLGFEARAHRGPSVLLIAPFLGMCTYGPFSLLMTWLFGYSATILVFSWLLFQGLVVLGLRHLARGDMQVETFCAGTHRIIFILLVAAGLWALLPVSNIYPAVFDGGLYVNENIFDHMKIAIVNSIAREGIPAKDPFYAPLGQQIDLIYYYAWHFVGAQIRTITGVTGWQAEVAMQWFTSFAVMGMLAGMAIRVAKHASAGFILLLLALTGPPVESFISSVGPRFAHWLGFPSSHSFEVIWIQLSWAPQHAVAGLCTVLALFLISHAYSRPQLRWTHAVVIGMVSAFAFSSSVWVGGVAVCIAFPVLVLALWRTGLPLRLIGTPLAASVAFAIVLALPVLFAVMSGPEIGGDHFPLRFSVYRSTGYFALHGPFQYLGHIVLYWIEFIPWYLGVVFVLGVLALAAYRSDKIELRAFKGLSVAAVFIYFIMAQFIKSSIANNDFGWRVVNVPYDLLLIWSSLVIAHLFVRVADWRLVMPYPFFARVVGPVSGAGIAIGVISSLLLWHLPRPDAVHSKPGSAELKLHRDFFQQRLAWREVEKYTALTDLVLSSARPYQTVVTQWPAPAPFALFGDRSSIYTDRDSVNTFAYSYPRWQKDKLGDVVSTVFSKKVTANTLKYLRDDLKVKSIILDYRDPVWPGLEISGSGIYREVESTEHFKIFVATE